MIFFFSSIVDLISEVRTVFDIINLEFLFRNYFNHTTLFGLKLNLTFEISLYFAYFCSSFTARLGACICLVFFFIFAQLKTPY
jgi:hypothetical protein